MRLFKLCALRCALQFLLTLGVVVFGTPAELRSQPRLDVTSETIFRAFERDDFEEENRSILPVYEYLQVDFGDPEGTGFSFHGNGWGRKDLKDSGFFEDDPDGTLLSAYLEYAPADMNMRVRAGRQQVFGGIFPDSVDGLWASATVAPWLGFSAYGGLPVALTEADDRQGDRIVGGRVFHRLDGTYELGVSYRQIAGDRGEDDRRVAADLFVSLPGGATVSGFSSYNLESEGWGEHAYEVNFQVAELQFRPLFQRYEYENFFTAGSISAQQFRFLADTGEILTLYGGDVLWRSYGGVEIGARYNRYEYDRRDETASFYGGLLNWRVGGVQLGGEIGRMDGGTAELRYLLTRGFFYWNSPAEFLSNGFLTGDLVYVRYDEQIFTKDSSLFLSLGVGRRFFDDRLELRISGDYSADPFFDSDLRGILWVVIRL